MDESDRVVDVAGAFRRLPTSEAIQITASAKRYRNSTSTEILDVELKAGRIWFYDNAGGRATAVLSPAGLSLESETSDWVPNETPASDKVGLAVVDGVLTLIIGSAAARQVGWLGSVVEFFEGGVYAGDPNWQVLTTDNEGTPGEFAGSVEWSDGPAASPRGSIKLTLPTGSGDQSVQLRSTVLTGMRIADIASLSYSTFAQTWNGNQLPYLTVYINQSGDPDGDYDDRLIFEPYYSTVESGQGSQANAVAGVWQNWDVAGGNSYTDSSEGFFTFAAYAALFPDAVVVNQDETRAGLRISNGFSSPEDAYETYVDSVAVNGHTYDFEQ